MYYNRSSKVLFFCRCAPGSSQESSLQLSILTLQRQKSLQKFKEKNHSDHKLGSTSSGFPQQFNEPEKMQFNLRLLNCQHVYESLNFLLPVEDEDLLLLPGVGDLHVGDHDAVDGGRGPVEVDAHLQGSSRPHSEVVVDQNLWKLNILMSKIQFLGRIPQIIHILSILNTIKGWIYSFKMTILDV